MRGKAVPPRFRTSLVTLLADAGLRPRLSRRGGGNGRDSKRTTSALSFHSLRRTATTFLHEAGVPQQVVQAMDAPIDELSKANLVAFRNARAQRVSPSSVNADLRVVRMLLLAAVRDEVISENPAKFVCVHFQESYCLAARRHTRSRTAWACRFLRYIVGYRLLRGRKGLAVGGGPEARCRST